MKAAAVTTLLLICLLSPTLSLKIRIPTGHSGGHPDNFHPPMGGHPYHLIKTCDSITPQISGADLLAYYSQDFYQGLANLHRQIVIVRHEIQNYSEYSYHRIVYRMSDAGFGLTFIALKIKVSRMKQVSIISYIQSSNYTEIVSMMGFPDNQMFSYPCGDLQSQCVSAYTKMVRKVNICNYPGGYDQAVSYPKKRRKYRRKRRKRRMMKHLSEPSYDSFDDIDSHDGPFKEINATIDMTDGHGRHITVGSSRP